MKAWEIERKKMYEAVPKILSEDEQTWDFAAVLEKHSDSMIKIHWASNVPGSYAPESIMIAAVQAMENKGFVIENADNLIEEGINALAEEDYPSLHTVSGQLWRAIYQAVPDYQHAYYSFAHYHSFGDVIKVINFPDSKKVVHDDRLLDKIHAGWLAQIIGGAVGTAIEGYPTQTIEKTFGPIRHYVRPPNTFNDDITFEIAFLRAYQKHHQNITSSHIADMWLRLIPLAWSAEECALRNLQIGIYPPESGQFQNPFSDWIGAQMRGAICGMLAPGNPREAARLAWIDAVISHDNNGALGEMFNAILTSLSFIEKDAQKLVQLTLDLIPKDSEYYQFANKAYQACLKYDNWRLAWDNLEPHFKTYNWIHAYPNIMAQIVALWFGENDFTETLHIIAMAGQDVDCNAAQTLCALGIMHGTESIPNSFRDPIDDRLDNYLRTEKVMSIKDLAKETFDELVKTID